MKDWENDDKGIKNNDNDHINHKNDGFKSGGKSVRRQKPYSKMKQNTIQYNTIQYSTVQYNTIQYNTTQHTT